MADLPAGATIGPYPYQIIRRLGRQQGGMSNVYLASVGNSDKPTRADLVALKIVRVDDDNRDFFRETLENEVERLRRLKHPGIVRLYPIQKSGLRNLPYVAQADLPGRPLFTVMEYLAGESLASLVRQQRQLDVGLALEIGRSIAATLDYMHSCHYVHLDIKPENILFRDPVAATSEIQPVLIDFGITRTTGQHGLEAGTLQWLAPERVMLARANKAPELAVPPDPSMDIYAVGMLLYYMIAGRLPFEGRTRQSITSAILENSPTAPSKYQPLIKPELDDVILRALAREPSQRPSAFDLARALEELAIRLGYRPRYGYHTAPGSVVVEPPRGRSGATWIAVFLAVLLIAETGFLAYRAFANPPASTPSPTVVSTVAPERSVEPTAVLESTPAPIITATAVPTIVTPTPTSPTSTPVDTYTPAPTSTLRPTRTPTPIPATSTTAP